MHLTIPKKVWKRPNDAASIPTIWHKLTTETRNNSRTLNKIRIQDMTSDQYNEVWDVFTEHFYPDDDVHQ